MKKLNRWIKKIYWRGNFAKWAEYEWIIEWMNRLIDIWINKWIKNIEKEIWLKSIINEKENISERILKNEINR